MLDLTDISSTEMEAFMGTTFGKSKANDAGDWQSGKEMKPAARLQ